MPLLFALTIFTSASLLFVIQPMFARMALPLLGGAPSVWNTALVFYQTMLLLGYGYSHLLTKYVKPRQQVLIHCGLLLTPLLVLPIAIPVGWQAPTTDFPIAWLLSLFAVALGLPFFVVSASSPLLQAWFGSSEQNRNPYVLYAMSNVGSMLALLAYPLIIEPNTSLRLQSDGWRWGYVLLVLLFIGCGIRVWQRAPQVVSSTTSQARSSITWQRRLKWIAWSAVPSSLLVSVTTYITTDIVAMPLLWVIPLALYLLTFIFVFANKVLIPKQGLVWLMPILVLLVILTIITGANSPILLLLILHLASLFVVTMVLHQQLADDRPEPQKLTEFYLLMSLGGVIGGIFNGLIAPLIFNSVWEYPLMLCLGLMLAPWRKPKPTNRQEWLQSLYKPGLMIVLSIGLVLLLKAFNYEEDTIGYGILFSLTMLLAYSQSRNPVSFGLSIGGFFMVVSLIGFTRSTLVYQERSFFGVNRILEVNDRFNILMHGTTLHGMQFLDPALSKRPLTYYSLNGPLNEIFQVANQQTTPKNVGVVGLGSGAAACYAQAQDSWKYFEIDPVVIEIAENPQYFSYLSQCTPQAPVVVGDARISLAAETKPFDVLIMDAYSSDAIPTHLVTVEALELYLSKLKPDGIIAFHISNRYLNLEPVLHDLAEKLGLLALVHEYNTDEDVLEHGNNSTKWVIFTKNQAFYQQFIDQHQWRSLQNQPNDRLWTDDYSSIITTLYAWQ
ncbi:fused MFS/spermidine synthase [Herpetosiphon giganteus]|uniref:fused MFS/spermidine synthase n=1 Tax=Herpetosiphon giganteus TaxID=2029754 RepID=UPI00195AC123|nr:fused MFS/spermidine synthase [Herpetosiphon giganteus]MBM7841678.1 SAM-dependent methyltransferase [Herpetosiphon giganteus]